MTVMGKEMGRFVFKLPDVGEGTAQAEIVAWHVAVGDHVKEDQLLVDVMTDKATVEMTSPVAGTVVALNAALGEMAIVGAPLVEFDLEQSLPEKPAAPAVVEAVVAERSAEPQAETVSSKVHAAHNKVLAAPAVRLRAADLGIDLGGITGSGPGGRITHGDLDDYLAGGAKLSRPAPKAVAAKDTVEEIKLIGLRRKIAEKMTLSARSIPHITYVEEIDMSAVEDLRGVLNGERKAGQPKLTVLPFFLRALVRTLPDFPEMNAHFDEEGALIRRFSAVHLGIATNTEAGLVVPVLRHAESLDIWQAASAIADAAEKARQNKASKEELSGSTITITSLGALGGIASTPILNHPEVAILGPNKIVARPVVKDGQIVIAKMMNLSASFDHRAVDGAQAARFVQRLKKLWSTRPFCSWPGNKALGL